ncbi:hypothetical protein HED63_27630 [Ochrobactrum cytisi]|nr:hypothetical protein [Brucella cytisi]
MWRPSGEHEQKPPHLNFLHCQEEAQHPVKAQVAQSVVMQFMNAFLVHGVEVDRVEPDYYNFCTRPAKARPLATSDLL